MKISSTLVVASFLLSVPVAFAEGPSDAQIASIVVTANSVDIDAGKYAMRRAHNIDVKAFARQMVVDHGGVNKQAVALVTRLKVTPADNATSQSLAAGGADNLKNLKLLKGAAFDKAYVDHEVAYHQQAIALIDNTLMPNAQNAELKSLLIAARPAFVGHLEHAQQIQAALPR
jgi:putative membrane protein